MTELVPLHKEIKSVPGKNIYLSMKQKKNDKNMKPLNISENYEKKNYFSSKFTRYTFSVQLL